jgi:hypothetical protein
MPFKYYNRKIFIFSRTTFSHVFENIHTLKTNTMQEDTQHKIIHRKKNLATEIWLNITCIAAAAASHSWLDTILLWSVGAINLKLKFLNLWNS